jgi:phosphonate transport system substrate-binding protein
MYRIILALFTSLGMFGMVLQASAEEPQSIRFAVSDVQGLEELQREFKAFQATLSRLTGLDVKFFPISGRTVGVEALRSKKLDILLTGPAEYVVIRQRAKAKPIVGLTRTGYYSVWVSLAKNGFKTLADLKGKKVAFGDVGSTAYHLSPLQILADAGLQPDKDYKKVHVSKHLAWSALKKGNVSAIGMNHSRYMLFLENEKELPDSAFTLLGKGGDLPNDLIVAGAHVSPEVVDNVRAAFRDHGDELVGEILKGERNQKYQGLSFYTDISDDDYDVVREMYSTAGYPEYLQG